MQRTSLPVVPMQLDSSIAIKISMGGSMFQERTLMGRSDVWHKIKILKGTQYSRESVLKAILCAIEPAELIPVKYQASGEDTFFLARNCAHALDKLCKTNLIIKNPEGDPLILIVTLGFASIQDLKLNIQPLIITALIRMYNSNRKILDLSAFHKDSEMSNTVYCPLSQQRTFCHVLKLTKTSISKVEHLNLQKNELFNLIPIETSGLTSIKYLDLRYNNLISMEALTPLKNLCILKLWLDGNPLCENYSSSKQYIDSALKYCPNLFELDGVYIRTSGLPLTYTNYFRNESREGLVTKFVNHFFALYDQRDRTVLRGLYCKNALYSMSLAIPVTVAHKRNLVQFTTSRNLLKNVDSNKKRQQHLYCGQDNILIILKRLPRSYHDRNSFVLDIMYDDGKCLAISVCGLLRTTSTTSQILWFNRTFIIQAGPDHEYNIINDQYLIDSTIQEISPNSIEGRFHDDVVPTCFSISEKKELLAKFVEATRLTTDWCQTYLEEAKWDIRKAISNFMKDYKSSAVPNEAFQK